MKETDYELASRVLDEKKTYEKILSNLDDNDEVFGLFIQHGLFTINGRRAEFIKNDLKASLEKQIEELDKYFDRI